MYPPLGRYDWLHCLLLSQPNRCLVSCASTNIARFIINASQIFSPYSFSHYKPSIAESMDMMNPQQTKVSL